jgi:type I restriction enzyme, S subunit
LIAPARRRKGFPILRIDDFQNTGSRSSDQLQQVDADGQIVKTYNLDIGDLVINRVNSPSHLGKWLVIEPRNIPALFESNMMRIKLVGSALPFYVAIYLRSQGGRVRLLKNAKWAVNQASINQGDVSMMPVPLPPLPEQHRIVAEAERRLSLIDNLEVVVAANLKRAGRLRQSILKRAFEGKLVPQDPADEPAEALLARIGKARGKPPRLLPGM